MLHSKDCDLPILEILNKFLHNFLYFLGLSFLKSFIHSIGKIDPTREFGRGSNETVYLNHLEACRVHP